jgi:hypothetical protein
VLTGLSRVIECDPFHTWAIMPLFAHEGKIDRGNDDDVHIRSKNSSNDEDDDDNDDNDDNGYGDFHNKSIEEHLSYKQLSIRRPSRRRIVKFQFS